MCLDLVDIWKSYPKQNAPALRGLSLTVPQGETIALAGESGSGKTTVLRLIAGFEEPDKGRIVYGDNIFVDSKNTLPAYKRKVAMVFQDLALFPHLDARANIAFAIKEMRRSARLTHAESLLARVGLAGRGNKYPHELSGGQQQRVALARALASQSDIILLDEPFSSLDHDLKWRLLQEIRAILQESGNTVIFVTHDGEEALAFANRIALLKDGMLLQQGIASEVFRNPNSQSVALFFGKINHFFCRRYHNQVNTDFGIFEISANGQANTIGIILIRPTACTIHPGTKKSPSPNTFSARVMDCRFMGEYWEVQLLPSMRNPPESSSRMPLILAHVNRSWPRSSKVNVTFPRDALLFISTP